MELSPGSNVSNNQSVSIIKSDALLSSQCDDMDAKRAFLEYELNLLDSLKDSLVNRANLLLAANGAIIGILALIITSDTMIKLSTSIVAIIAFYITSFFLAASLFYTLCVVRIFKSKSLNLEEHMHFRVILKIGKIDMQNFLLSLNKDVLINEFLNQIFGLSRHIEKRYDYLCWAFRFFLCCLISFFFAFIYASVIIFRSALQ